MVTYRINVIKEVQYFLFLCFSNGPISMSVISSFTWPLYHWLYRTVSKYLGYNQVLVNLLGRHYLGLLFTGDLSVTSRCSSSYYGLHWSCITLVGYSYIYIQFLELYKLKVVDDTQNNRSSYLLLQTFLWGEICVGQSEGHPFSHPNWHSGVSWIYAKIPCIW